MKADCWPLDFLFLGVHPCSYKVCQGSFSVSLLAAGVIFIRELQLALCPAALVWALNSTSVFLLSSPAKFSSCSAVFQIHWMQFLLISFHPPCIVFHLLSLHGYCPLFQMILSAVCLLLLWRHDAVLCDEVMFLTWSQHYPTLTYTAVWDYCLPESFNFQWVNWSFVVVEDPDKSSCLKLDVHSVLLICYCPNESIHSIPRSF